MDRCKLIVQFECNEDDASYLFKFPCGERLHVPGHDVERSRPLRDMIESATTSGETIIPLPSGAELTHFHTWAAAVQPDCPVFQVDAESLKRTLEAADFLADEGMMQRLAAAYDVQLFPIEARGKAVAPDADSLRVLEGMRGELASTILAGSSLPVGERAWLLPARLHPLDDDIVAATAAAEEQRTNPDGQKVAAHPRGGSILQVSVSPEGRLFATCGVNGHVAVWHTGTSRLVRALQGYVAGKHCSCHAWSPDGSQLVTGCINGTGDVDVYDVATGAVKASLEGHGCHGAMWRRAVASVAWSPDGHKLCTGSFDRTARVWEVATGDVLQVLAGSQRVVHSVAWSRDSFIATGSGDGTVRIWDAATGAEIHLLYNSRGLVTSVAWSPDGGMLAAASEDSTTVVWDAATGTAKLTLTGHTEPVISVAWSPGGRHLATGSNDGSVRVWDVATGSSVHVIATKADELCVTSVAWSPCGNLLFASMQKAVRIYNVSGGQLGTQPAVTVAAG